MTASEVLKLVVRITWDFLNPEIVRFLLLLLVAWTVLLLAQIRRLLTQLAKEGPVRSSVPPRDEPPSLDDLISRH
jgi:hypothetical protein